MNNHTVNRELPDGLEALADLALDLRWSGSLFAGRVWSMLDETTWERTGNPHVILLGAHQERLEAAAADVGFRAELDEWMHQRAQYLEEPGWFEREHDRGLRRIAYFSMEFGLGEGLPIYSGGLGILAGDHLKSASDLGVPLVGIGLLYQQGYFRQVIDDDGRQVEAFPYNDPGSLPIKPVIGPDGRRPRVRIPLPGRTLFVRVWQARVGRVTLYLLDTNDPMNAPWDRAITANLYAAGQERRLLQEVVLGVGGWALLEKLGIDVDVCHLNEGHAAFAVLARAWSFAAAHDVSFAVGMRATRTGNVFTTHTPVGAAFDRFDPRLIARYATPFLEQTGLTLAEILAAGRRNPADHEEPFNMAYLAMRGCGRVNGVSRLHGAVSRRLFSELFPRWPHPEVPVGHVTNGVHVPTWGSVAANQIWGAAWPDDHWPRHLEHAAAALARVPEEALWSFRGQARRELVEYVRRRLRRQIRERGGTEAALERTDRVLDPALTLGFARRFTENKRPNLLLHDAERFARLLSDPHRPVQLIVAGKAHPDDGHGKEMVQVMARFAARSDVERRVVFLQDYDIALAQHLAAGIDVWINTPRRPVEACGTSGMKMLVNGGLNLSVRDGWWDEAYAPDAGWAVGAGDDPQGPEDDVREALHLYELLEREVVPEYHRRDERGIPRAWVARVRTSMSRLTAAFSSDRMVREYVERVYLPAARAYAGRTADGAAAAHDVERWSERVARGLDGVRFGAMNRTRAGARWRIGVEVDLGPDLDPDDVRVELYAEPRHGAAPVRVTMEPGGPRAAGTASIHVAEVPADRPPEHYTPRVVPHHPAAAVPLETPHIRWRSPEDAPAASGFAPPATADRHPAPV